LQLICIWILQKEETRSRQKTGTVEEVDEYVRNMTDIVLLYDSVSTNDAIKQNAKGKLATRKAKGSQVRRASQQGQVRKRDLMELDVDSDLESGSEPPAKIIRAPKNQFAKEVESVISGIHEKADEFKIAMEEKSERDKELGNKLDKLIETTKSTNETMERLMNVIIQGATKNQ
jgi:hypothetical protein